jgi:hypothetical protein
VRGRPARKKKSRVVAPTASVALLRQRNLKEPARSRLIIVGAASSGLNLKFTLRNGEGREREEKKGEEKRKAINKASDKYLWFQVPSSVLDLFHLSPRVALESFACLLSSSAVALSVRTYQTPSSLHRYSNFTWNFHHEASMMGREVCVYVAPLGVCSAKKLSFCFDPIITHRRALPDHIRKFNLARPARISSRSFTFLCFTSASIKSRKKSLLSCVFPSQILSNFALPSEPSGILH